MERDERDSPEKLVKICKSCVNRIDSEVAEYMGKNIKLGAHSCSQVIHENGRRYSCYYFFVKDRYLDYENPKSLKIVPQISNDDWSIKSK